MNLKGSRYNSALISKSISISSHVLCSVQFSSVAQLCLTLCDPMNRSQIHPEEVSCTTELGESIKDMLLPRRWKCSSQENASPSMKSMAFQCC